MQLWLLALVLGTASGLAAIGLRFGIAALEEMFYGADDRLLATRAAELPWWWLVAVPLLGGLIVGQITHRFTPDGRVQAVADVIEGAALNKGRVDTRAGWASALASLVTLGMGGSTGREGPAVHLGAVLSSHVARLIRADGMTGRDLLGCATAAAVAASFNAPIAGAIFAHEVILRHFALHAIAPISIAALAGTVVNRVLLGDVPEFVLATQPELVFYAELPAFVLLGLFSGLVAGLVMRAEMWGEDAAAHVVQLTRLPPWLRPALAGALLGALAIAFPHVIGVGYETTNAALAGRSAFGAAILFAVVKTVAMIITLAGRLGGGVFSPSLMIGALTGLAFGHVATALAPGLSGSETLYAMAGMGAVAGAVLGAPLSTMLIALELTASWQVGLAVMAAVPAASALAGRIVERSFFLTQLERRGIHLAAGPQAWLLATLRVRELMRPLGAPAVPDEEALWELVEKGLYVDVAASLEAAMPIFETAGTPVLAVVRLSGADQPPELVGALRESDALRAYNRALAETAAEEHS
ncbi:MAG: chloride channel protein [Alphaproteobacteria bacterium]|nr:MAG: chloride channel protein [Alphaproteobacteria bacterium]